MQTVKETAQRAAEFVKEGTQSVAAALGRGGSPAEAAAADEAGDALPPAEPDRDLGHTAWQKPAGPLQKMRETAAHAVEGVKLRLHLGSHGGEQGAGRDATAEKRSGEPLHMAKAAEGRNKEVDDPIDHAMHDALKLESGERPETSAFPETLGDALAVAQMRDLPNSPPSAIAAAAATDFVSSNVEPAPPNPFSASARPKL